MAHDEHDGIYVTREELAHWERTGEWPESLDDYVLLSPESSEAFVAELAGDEPPPD